MRSIFLLACAFLFSLEHESLAQEKEIDTVQNFKLKVPQKKRFYVGNGLDFGMVSTALVSKPLVSSHLTVPRFTGVVNLGFTFHYDLNNRIGFISGVGLRNMGFIDKISDTTIKRRIYALGIPLGIKLGDLRSRNFLLLGGGIDLPLHYREKTFVQRSNKEKENEWFSDKTPRVMPFIFAGYSFDPGITLKFQYYPGNFLNTGYEETAKGFFPGGPPLIKPYLGYTVHLLLLSLGIDIHYNQYRIQEKEYQDMKKEREQQKKLL